MVFLCTLEAKHMTRLTVTLDDELHQALKETAARQGRTIGSIVEESLRMRGIRTVASARDLVAKARTGSGLDENQALSVALEETRRLRGK
jgi:predicted transcriptional regulator